MQIASSRIWYRLVEFISYNDVSYATGVSLCKRWVVQEGFLKTAFLHPNHFLNETGKSASLRGLTVETVNMDVLCLKVFWNMDTSLVDVKQTNKLKDRIGYK